MTFEAQITKMTTAIKQAIKVMGDRFSSTEEDVARAIREVKKGRVEFMMDKQADIHLAIGKISFEEKAIMENFLTFYDGLLKARPASAKGQYVRSVALSSTMGPGLKLDLITLKKETS